LEKLSELREREASTLSYIIEHATYLLWRHLDYYFVHCVPTEDDTFDRDTSYKSGFSRLRKLTDAAVSPAKLNISSPKKSTKLTSTGISKEDLEKLRIESSTMLTDQLWKKVLESDTVQGQARSRLAFTSALVRRIQGMVQLNS
jgi:nuclear pore complex protein Nup205